MTSFTGLKDRVDPESLRVHRRAERMLAAIGRPTYSEFEYRAAVLIAQSEPAPTSKASPSKDAQQLDLLARRMIDLRAKEMLLESGTVDYDEAVYMAAVEQAAGELGYSLKKAAA